MKKLRVLTDAPIKGAATVDGSTMHRHDELDHGQGHGHADHHHGHDHAHHDHARGEPEFPEGAEFLEVPGEPVSRRRFFGLVGSGAALAGLTSTTGCIRKPKENILPFSDRPEDMIPGRPVEYASVFQLGSTIEGILVESQDGRPTKIEGNPKHPGSLGSTSLWAQASVLDVYDPDRSRYAVGPTGDSVAIRGPGSALEAVSTLLEEAAKTGGEGLALVLPFVTSPTEIGLLAEFATRFPKARMFLDDPMVSAGAAMAAEQLAGPGARNRVSLVNARVVVSADCNFFGAEPDATRLSREWSARRRVTRPEDEMSRLYVFEPHMSSVGVMADHRRRVKGSQVGDVLLALAHALGAADREGKLRIPAGLNPRALPAPSDLGAETQAMIAVLARDLLEATSTGGSAIVVGSRQPAWVHALALGINAALGNLEGEAASIGWAASPGAQGGGAQGGEGHSLGDLAQGLANKSIQTVIAVQCNPAYDAAAITNLKTLLGAATLVHFGQYRDETGVVAKWHIPLSHALEAWGDAMASDGTVSIRQPLIEPLFGTDSQTEVLALVATGRAVDGYSLVKGHWIQQQGTGYREETWRRWLHDGIAPEVKGPSVASAPSNLQWSGLLSLFAAREPAISGWEIDFEIDPKVADGRYANNAWLQELPHPITKLVWDNAAYLSKASAERLGVENEDLLQITIDGRSLTLPVFVALGQADESVTIALGYGRTVTPHHNRGHVEPVANGAGHDVAAIRPSEHAWIVAGEVKRTSGRYSLSNTQVYGSQRPRTGNDFIDETVGKFSERAISIEATREDWQRDPTFVENGDLVDDSRLQHLWDPPELKGPHQWGMSIDLNSCMGCNACVVACQSENNIPVVGKTQAKNGREMHWMRIDRYYRGDENDPTAVLQPMLCQHCESAPCETVCPVNATAHSPEGLNDMAYNRCIGTRYCSNNCPYKVRRYNFFAYNLDVRPTKFWNEDTDGAWLEQMQKNPDVTIRFRGVMEKCTYCVQRINQAKIASHVAGKGLVEDGAIKTACQQVCPTQAIVFGNVSDPNSAVSRAKSNPRDYSLLHDLNTKPRTTYLARIRNAHPDLPRPIPEVPPPKPNAEASHEPAPGGEHSGADNHHGGHGH